MRKLLRLAWNDIRIEFSDRTTLVFFLLLPLLFTTVVGLALGGSGQADPNADNRFPVLVVDEDQSALAQELVAVLEASEVVRPAVMTADEAQTQFDDQQAPAVLTIPPELSEAVLAGQPISLRLLMRPDDNQVYAVQQAVSAAAGQVSSMVAAAQVSVDEVERIHPFESAAARQIYFEQGLDMARDLLQQPAARVETTRAATVVPQEINGFEQASSGQLVTWVLITLIGAAEVFVGERLGGTLRRLVVTPTSKATILSGKIAGQALSVAGGKAQFELKRTVRHSPTEGAKAPAGAVVLFDGGKAGGFQPGVVLPDGNLLSEETTKQGFGDYTLHLEFRLSYMPEARGQHRSNSGVYLHDCYEVQVLDSFGLEGEDNECGGFYQLRKPDVNMCYPPLTWQTYDIEYRVEKKGWKPVGSPRLTVYHNGVKIHDNVQLRGDARKGNFHFQDHGNPVRYRNIWVLPEKQGDQK